MCNGPFFGRSSTIHSSSNKPFQFQKTGFNWGGFHNTIHSNLFPFPTNRAQTHPRPGPNSIHISRQKRATHCLATPHKVRVQAQTHKAGFFKVQFHPFTFPHFVQTTKRLFTSHNLPFSSPLQSQLGNPKVGPWFPNSWPRVTPTTFGGHASFLGRPKFLPGVSQGRPPISPGTTISLKGGKP